MAKDSLPVRCAASLFSTPESAIGGVVWTLLILNIASASSLLLLLWLPEWQIILVSLAGLFLMLALLLGMASVTVLRHGLSSLAGELHSIFSTLQEG
jgi:hypothetical protein